MNDIENRELAHFTWSCSAMIMAQITMHSNYEYRGIAAIASFLLTAYNSMRLIEICSGVNIIKWLTVSLFLLVLTSIIILPCVHVGVNVLVHDSHYAIGFYSMVVITALILDSLEPFYKKVMRYAKQ